MPTSNGNEPRLGVDYRDEITGFEGRSTGLYLFIHGCTRVVLSGKSVDAEGNVEPVEYVFDAPQLIEVGTEKPVTTEKPGGDAARDPRGSLSSMRRG